MNRTGKFIYNSLSAALLQIVSLLSGILIPITILRAYGSEINGMIASIMQFIAYINLIEAGLASASIYALYKPLAERNDVAISSVVSASRKQYMTTGYLFVTLVVFLALLYPIFVRSEALPPFSVGTLVLLLGVSGAMEFFTMAKYRVLLTADQKTYVLSLASIVGIVIYTVIIIVFAKAGVHILLLQFMAISAVLVRSSILAVYVKKKYPQVNYAADPDYKALDKRNDALFLQVLGSVHNATPIVIATVFTTLKMVSVFSIYAMIIGGVNGVVRIFTAGLPASFGDLIARKEKVLLRQAYQEFELGYYMIIAVVYSCCMVLLMPFIDLYTRGVEDANYSVPVLGMLFIANGIFYSLKNPQGMLVISAGMFRETRAQTLAQGIIAVVGGIIFVQFWGLAGIVFGSLLSNIYRSIDLLIFVPRHITGLEVGRSLKRILVALFSMAMVYVSFSHTTISFSGYRDFFLYALLVAVYSLVVVLLINYFVDRSVLMSAGRRVLNTVRKFFDNGGLVS